MNNKIIIGMTCVLLLIGGTGYIFKHKVWEVVVMFAAKDTFIAADTDNFDPGLAVGEVFPKIRVLYQGREVKDVREFEHHKGMVFIANRSAVW